MELKHHLLLADVYNFVKDDPAFASSVVENVMDGLTAYSTELRKKNANIDLIVRNLKPEHYAELKKYVVPEVFENLGLQDAIAVIEKQNGTGN